MARTDEEKLALVAEAKKKLAEREKRIRQRINARTRKEDTRRKIVVGSVVMAHMEHDENFRHIVETVLKNWTQRDTDRKLLGLPPLK